VPATAAAAANNVDMAMVVSGADAAKVSLLLLKQRTAWFPQHLHA
jgi:hypothetical protein